MSATFLLAGALACARLVASAEQVAQTPEGNSQPQAEAGPAIRPAASKITDVTIYQGRALVTREVTVPEGNGTLELLVSPLPPQVEDASLYAEGTDGVRVLSTRFRTRAVTTDTREEVRAKQELVSKLQTDAKRLEREVKLQQVDLKFLDKLGGFTGTALAGLADKGRIESEPIIALSKFIMENRSVKTKAEVELQRQLEANNETAEFTERQLTELSAGKSRVERDAVIVVLKSRNQPSTVRLGYLVTAANWVPHYRLRGGGADAPVRFEYLASVVQQTGETWSGVRVTLSTARPSLDAAPPDLIPLKLAVAGGGNTGPTDAHDDRSQKVLTELNKPLSMSFNEETPLEDVLKYVKHSTAGSAFPNGLPMYLDPVGLREADKTVASTVRNVDLEGIPLKTTLKMILNQIDLTYVVKDGVLTITSNESAGRDENEDLDRVTLTDDSAAIGPARDEASGSGAAKLNLAAASDQASELKIGSGQGADSSAAETLGSKRDLRDRGQARSTLSQRPAIARSRPTGDAGRVLREGGTRDDTAGLSPGEAYEQERRRVAARRGDRLCGHRFRRPDALAPRGRGRTVRRWIWSRSAGSGQSSAGAQVSIGTGRQSAFRLRVPDRAAQLSSQRSQSTALGPPA